MGEKSGKGQTPGVSISGTASSVRGSIVGGNLTSMTVVSTAALEAALRPLFASPGAAAPSEAAEEALWRAIADVAGKENQARRDMRIAALQALDAKLADAHRQMKSSKRRLRSRLDRTDPDRPAIAKSDFEECMDQLLASQIAVEEVQDLIAARRDLIKKSDMSLIDEALQYAARYLHDVFEDFEQGKVTRDADKFLLDKVATQNLCDFLLNLPETGLIAAQRDIIKNEHRSYEDRHRALAIVEEHRPRFGKVALECMRLASSELKRLIDIELF